MNSEREVRGRVRSGSAALVFGYILLKIKNLKIARKIANC